MACVISSTYNIEGFVCQCVGTVLNVRNKYVPDFSASIPFDPSFKSA